MGDILRPSNTGSGAPDTSAFIQYVGDREPQTQKKIGVTGLTGSVARCIPMRA